MNFSDIKRVGFVILLVLLILLLVGGLLWQSGLLKSPAAETPAEPPAETGLSGLEPLNQPSPDGSYIAGVSAEDPGMHGSAITLKREGAKDLQIIAGGDEKSWVTNPIWSPDGKSVAYLRVVNAQISQYEIDSVFELWVYDLKSGESRLITDSANLNPAISFDGNTDIKWLSDTQLQYPDNEAFPIVYYTVDIYSLETTSKVSDPKGGKETVGVNAQPGIVPYFSQCGSPWGSTVLGTCSQYTICQQGCAMTSVAMIFKYFGVSTDPGLMNEWLKSHGGYFSGCLINWAVAANYASDKISFVARIDNADWSRLHYELDNGYPVILEVPFTNGQHFVVATGYSGDTVFINDPYYSSRTTLDSYGNTFKGLRVYHGPTSTPATCPASTDTRVFDCTPALTPAYDNNACSSLWYPITGFNGNPTYLVENAATAATSTNQGRWKPNLTQAGRYKAEAFIAAHGTFSKACSASTLTFGADSSKAKYTIYSRGGTVTDVVRDQLPLNNEWLNLGEYYFDAGKEGYVVLTDLTGEDESSRNLSFGAMRFTLVGPAEYPVPQVNLFSPALKPVGAKDFTLTVTGKGFYPQSVLRWNGSDRPTTYVNATTLTATIPATDLVAPVTASITVINPAPGGGESTPLIFPVINFTPWKGDQLTTSKVTIDWDDIPGAALYKVQLSSRSDFASLVFSAKTTQSTYFHDAYLKYNSLYYWRIKYKINDTWSTWSPAFKFTAMDPLAPPELISPGHKLRVYDTNILLSWQPVVNGVSYKLQIARDAGFVQKVVNETFSTTSASFTLPDGKYYWRVRALDPYGAKGPWSDVRIFKVDAVP